MTDIPLDLPPCLAGVSRRKRRRMLRAAAARLERDANLANGHGHKRNLRSAKVHVRRSKCLVDDREFVGDYSGGGGD